jgi:hypothetical protein
MATSFDVAFAPPFCWGGEPAHHEHVRVCTFLEGEKSGQEKGREGDRIRSAHRTSVFLSVAARFRFRLPETGTPDNLASYSLDRIAALRRDALSARATARPSPFGHTERRTNRRRHHIGRQEGNDFRTGLQAIGPARCGKTFVPLLARCL